MTSTSGPGRRRFPLALPPWTQLRRAAADGVVVGLSCLLTYWLATTILAHVYSPSAADDELGGLWAVVATVFVLRETYDKSVAAAGRDHRDRSRLGLHAGHAVPDRLGLQALHRGRHPAAGGARPAVGR